MKYTFLLPAYKTKFLNVSITSILAQSYGDFSVLVSDDCSPEDIKGIVDGFNDSRISYRRNEKNIGAKHLVDHWNLLLEQTDAGFVIMASDDDLYHPNFLKTIDELQQKYPDVDLLRARIQHIDGNGDVLWKEQPLDEYQNPLEAVCQCPDTCVPNYVFRRKKLIEIGGFVDFPYAMGSDTATAMAMSMNGVANTLEALFSYRLSESQISCHHQDSKMVKKEKLSGLFSIYDYCMKFVDEMKYSDTEINRRMIENYKSRITTALPHLTMKYVSSLSLKEAWKAYKMLYKRKCFERGLQKLEFISGYFQQKL